MKLQFIRAVVCTATIFAIAGCSTTRKIPKSSVPEVPPTVAPVEKTIINNAFAEREFIHNSKILSIDKIKFNYILRNKLGNGERYSQQKFNQDGFLIETIFYDKQGKVETNYTYQYDSNGYLSETIQYNSSGKQEYKYTY